MTNLIENLCFWQKQCSQGVVCPCPWTIYIDMTIISNISSESTVPNAMKAKFYLEPLLEEEKKVCLILFLNLQQMTIVIRHSCWYQNFGPNGLSASTLGLCLNFFSSITADFNISSALRWAIQDQWSSGSIFFQSLCFFFFFFSFFFFFAFLYSWAEKNGYLISCCGSIKKRMICEAKPRTRLNNLKTCLIGLNTIIASIKDMMCEAKPCTSLNNLKTCLIGLNTIIDSIKFIVLLWCKII